MLRTTRHRRADGDEQTTAENQARTRRKGNAVARIGRTRLKKEQERFAETKKTVTFAQDLKTRKVSVLETLSLTIKNFANILVYVK